MQQADVVIIGGGPAGASAATFIAKAGYRVIVIDNGQSITKKAWIRNHLGLLDITGPELVELGKKQATSFGTTWVEATATDVQKKEDGLHVVTDGGTYVAKHVVFASGLWTDLAERIGLHVVPAREPRIKSAIAVDADGRTNIDGIWAAGTVAGASVHTIITAGDGAKVAVAVISELKGERYVDHDLLTNRPTRS